jgi:hypothetical protein
VGDNKTGKTRGNTKQNEIEQGRCKDCEGDEIKNKFKNKKIEEWKAK